MATTTILAVDEDGILICPACESVWTHVDRVEALSATGTALALTAGGEDSAAQVGARPIPGRDIGRRHEFVIYIECETCGETSTVRLQQHKGQTMTQHHHAVGELGDGS